MRDSPRVGLPGLPAPVIQEIPIGGTDFQLLVSGHQKAPNAGAWWGDDSHGS
jgi:hypothetical protein